MSRLLGTSRPPPRVHALTGQRLEPVRLAGVLLVSAGTLLSARGAYSEAPTAEAGWLAVGCAALVGGTALHAGIFSLFLASVPTGFLYPDLVLFVIAGMFVFSERAMRLGGLHPFLLSSGMGAAETAALAAWNGAVSLRGTSLLDEPSVSLLGTSPTQARCSRGTGRSSTRRTMARSRPAPWRCSTPA